MAPDAEYKPIPVVYRSRGLVARDILDQAPEYTYLQFMNMYEREENALSSRFGTQIINRDPAGTGTSNHFFTSPVTSLSRLTYQSNAWRYAGLQDGTLQRRAGNTQGAYTQIYSGLSGKLFGSLVNNSFQASTGYLYIYDANASIKDNGSGTPSLTGIDPSPYTATTVPYSPLLTMIDSFAATNIYSTAGISGWAHGVVTSLQAAAGQTVTDFSEFSGVQQSGATVYTPSTGLPASATITVVGTNGSNTSGTVSGYPSVVISAGETINVTVNLSASVSIAAGPGGGGGSLSFQYSPDGGSTWSTFYGFGSSTTQSISGYNATVTINGSSNLNLVQFRVVATAASSGSPPPSVTATGTINSAAATVNSPGVFGGAVNGMVSLLNTNALASTGIVSVVSSGLSSGVYGTLTVTTVAAHGLTTLNWCSLYGTSNPIANGFYRVASVPSPTTLTVAYGSSAPLSATGGFVNSCGTAPYACVLNNMYSTPYPPQMSAWGFYQQVPTTTTSFPVGSWSGTVSASSTGTISASGTFDLSQNNQVTDDDLIVIVLNVQNPNNVDNIRLQFDVNGSSYGATYYYKDISPAYYQGSVANQVAAYQATQQQILADTLNLVSGLPPGSTQAQLQPGNLSTGPGAWQAIYLRRGDFLPVGNAGESGTDWANVTGWEIVVATNSGGSSSVACNGLYLQWGYGPSSFAGVGYDYRYTYYNAATGAESNGSPIQNFSEQFGYLATLAPPILLRQAAQVEGYFSLDTQVTHINVYRRGGAYGDNWRKAAQIPNVATTSATFFFKDTVADADLAQAPLLVLDNDPPVTSSLPSPINTTLAAATVNLIGLTPYQAITPAVQTVTTADNAAVFVANQIVLVGNANNLEEVRVVNGGTGQFDAIFYLQHNAGEPVIAYSTPRVHCNICAVAQDGQVYIAGDPNNPHYLYYSKRGYPESFGPQNYIPVGAPDDPIMAVINWRGAIVVATQKTWYIIVGGARPYAQPTGADHGVAVVGGWTLVEGTIWFRASDGLREFTGANGVYRTLPVEWIFQGNPLCLPPQAYQSSTQVAASQDILCYYRNQVYDSFISNNAGAPGTRYRNVYHMLYQRFRQDDVPATAMLWERDTDVLVVGKQIGAGQYAVVQDQVGDYDDGGWNAGVLVQTPINLTIQHPYRDLGAPHNPKQWNQYETDVNTQNQVMHSTLYFEDGASSVVLSDVTTASRQKVELQVNAGEGQQAYRASLVHTMAVTVAPIFYQENIYATVLAEYSATFDTYWIKFGTDADKFVKQGWFDYTSALAINVSLYADNSSTPYFTFTLPAQTQRDVVRVRFSNVNPAAPAFTLRTWRLIGVTAADAGANKFQMWAKPRIEWKPANGGQGYAIKELEV